jgi:hypothetical protein
MRIALLVAALVLLTIALLNAAIPPLPEKALREGADVIVTGVITTVEHQDKANADPEYVNREYSITIRIEKTEKGAVTGETLVAHTWKPLKRPAGWAGPQGQNVTPTETATVRAFLQREAGAETFTLMLPNGLEEIEATTKPAR